MIKVCYIITKLELGGAQKVALYTAENLNKNDFQNFLITGKGGILIDKACQNLKVYQLAKLVREISPYKDLKALWHIYTVLKAEKPDIVHTHSSKAGVLGRIAAKLAGIKVIVHTIHGYGFNETQKFYIKYLYIFLERFSAFLSHKLIAVTNEDINKGLKYKIAPKDKFTLIRAGINTKFYKDYLPLSDFRSSLVKNQETKIITTIGPFKPQKNLKDFIKAAEIVAKEIKDVLFIIVGDGVLRPELEKQIEESGLKDKILMLGWRLDIAAILNASDIFVMTSLWEGLPCTIVEAMCCSKPVIANAVDGVKEIIKENENGYLIEPHNFQKTAEKIIYLLSNEKERLEMGKRAKLSITEEYDLEYMLKQHEELYKSLYKTK